jgi:trehalose-6-phosphatase
LNATISNLFFLVCVYVGGHTTGSVIEVKESCVAWHYRDCDVGHGAWQAKQCIVSLVELAKRTRATEVSK